MEVYHGSIRIEKEKNVELLRFGMKTKSHQLFKSPFNFEAFSPFGTPPRTLLALRIVCMYIYIVYFIVNIIVSFYFPSNNQLVILHKYNPSSIFCKIISIQLSELCLTTTRVVKRLLSFLSRETLLCVNKLIFFRNFCFNVKLKNQSHLKKYIFVYSYVLREHNFAHLFFINECSVKSPTYVAYDA